MVDRCPRCKWDRLARSWSLQTVLTNGAAERLASMMPAGHEAVIHITITDEYPYAQAFVVIEARLAA